MHKTNSMVSSSGDVLLRNLSSTTIKLYGKNYLIWAKSIQVFLGAHKKIKHITQDSPNINAPEYEDWLASDYGIITWLVNSMEPEISRGVVMLPTAKKISDTLKATYAHEKNIACVVELYDQFFTLQQGDQSAQELYTSIRVLLDELEVYQPLVPDVIVMQEYREELVMPKSLFALKPELASQAWGQILGGDTVPSLTIAFSHVLCIATSTPIVHNDQSTLATYGCRRDTGHGRGRDSGGGCSARWGNLKCDHCGHMNHSSDRCWAKFGKPD